MPGSADSGRDHPDGNGSGRRGNEGGRGDGASGKSSSKSSPDCNSNLLAHSVIVPLPHHEGALNPRGPPLLDFRHRHLLHRPWADGEDPHQGLLPPPAHLGPLGFLPPRGEPFSLVSKESAAQYVLEISQLEEAQRQASMPFMPSYLSMARPMHHAGIDLAAMRQIPGKRVHNNGESTESSMRDFILHHPHLTDGRHHARIPFCSSPGAVEGYPTSSTSKDSHRDGHRDSHRESKRDSRKSKDEPTAYSRSESAGSSGSAGTSSSAGISRQQSLASSNGSLSRQGSTASETNDSGDHKVRKTSESSIPRSHVSMDTLTSHPKTSSESEVPVHSSGCKSRIHERSHTPISDREPDRPASAKMESAINTYKETTVSEVTSVSLSPPVTSPSVFVSKSMAVSSAGLHAPTVVSSPPPLTVISQSSSVTTATSSLSVSVPATIVSSGEASISPTGSAMPVLSSLAVSTENASAENLTSKSTDIAGSSSGYRWPMTKKKKVPTATLR